MLFNSWSFLIFFPLVTAAYFLLPHRFRWAFLLAASCVFYMAFIPKYLVILFAAIAIDYTAGLFIAGATGARRRLLLALSVVSNLGLLAFFKYFNFFNDNLRQAAALLHWNYPIGTLAILLPLGLSFHTFQSLAYVIEVYRGAQAPERHLGIYALYVMFYPQLVAGPIERPQNLLHQFRLRHDFNAARVNDGLRLMFRGFFKKVVIADRLALVVNPIFDHATRFTGLSLWLAVLFFSFQIYCDFSGYSDIARGAARVMGFELMVNFDRPYQSRTIVEFWRRWHISLSTWFKDYMYIPLGGNRVPELRRMVNLLAVFLVSGLWHGAAWTFVIWGALHGIYEVIEISGRKAFGALSLARLGWAGERLQEARTFLLVAFAWIFFRAHSLSDAGYIVGHLGRDLATQIAAPATWWHGLSAAAVPSESVVIGLVLIVALYAAERLPTRGAIAAIAQTPWLQMAVYQAGLLVLILFGVYNDQAFIYFQF